MKSVLTSFFLLLLSTAVFAQSKLTFEGYIDAYYSYFDNDLLSTQPLVSTGARQSIGVNMASLSTRLASKNYRGNLTFHSGETVSTTWSSEFPYIQEANVGIHLLQDLWLDVGLFTTHIGAESFLPRNNFISSTSIITFNEPFYQGGLKLSYEKFKNWTLELWLANGYNLFVDNNKAKSIGSLISYSVNDNLSFTFANLIGNEPDGDSGDNYLKMYSNFYMNYAHKYFNVLLSVDDGRDYMKNNYGNMSSFIGAFQVLFTNKISASFRYEYQNDPKGNYLGTFVDNKGNMAGIAIQGFTFGAEYKPSDNSYLRAESIYLKGKEGYHVFGENDADRWQLLFTTGVYFEK